MNTTRRHHALALVGAAIIGAASVALNLDADTLFQGMVAAYALLVVRS